MLYHMITAELHMMLVSTIVSTFCAIHISSIEYCSSSPQITHRDTLSLVTELTGAAITTRGQYNRPGTMVPPGERKLYLLIEGSSESSIKKAKAELKKILAETQEKVMRRDPPSGKYSVM